jgi:DNA helicase-2/ATP-dependent DNA helicase PcrA
VLAAFAKEPDPDFPEQIRRAWRWCSDRCPAVVDLDPGDRAERKAAEDDAARRRRRGEGLGADAAEIEDGRSRHARSRRTTRCSCAPTSCSAASCGRARTSLEYEHLFVDEAQDLAPIDLAVLLDCVVARTPARATDLAPSVTLAGDTAQRLHMDAGFRDWRAVLDDLGLSRTSTSSRCASPTARRSRCSSLRARRARPLADPTPPIAPPQRRPVEHHHFPSPGAAVAFLADAIRPLFVREPRATVAILARHAEQADVYYEALKMAEIPNLRRIRAYEFAFRPAWRSPRSAR